MAKDYSIVQGAAGGVIVQPTWGTLDGAGGEQGGINVEQIITDIQALLEDELNEKINEAPVDGNEYVRKDGAWSQLSQVSLTWGSITGNISAQLDLQAVLNAKQNILTFDDSPASGSNNPVKSGGIFTALAGKSDTGHNHDADYVNVTGDTMTGQLVLSATGFRTSSDSGYYLDSYGNFKHLSDSTADFWHIDGYSGNKALSVYFDTGEIKGTNHITIEKDSEVVFTAKNTGITIGTAPSALTWVGGIAMKDNSNTNVGYVETYYSAEKTVTTRILARNKVNGSYVNSILDLAVGESGAQSAIFNSEVTISRASQSGLIFKTTDGGASSYIRAYKDSDSSSYGNNLVIHAGGSLILGGGESANNIYSNNIDGAGGNTELLFLGSDGNVYIYSNCNTIGNRKRWDFRSDSNFFLPGPWTIYDSRLDAAASSLSSNNYIVCGVRDPSGKYIAYIQSSQLQDGSTQQQIAARHYSDSTNYVDNNLTLKVAANGTRSVLITEAAPWRSALGLGSVATESTVPINKGGTNATTAAAARVNLGHLGMFFSEGADSSECTSIASNKNLNTAEFTVTGKYVCSSNATAQTLSNSPTTFAFQMLVFNLLTNSTGAMPSGSWSSRTQILMEYTGNIFVRNVSRGSDGTYSYAAWKKVTLANA